MRHTLGEAGRSRAQINARTLRYFLAHLAESHRGCWLDGLPFRCGICIPNHLPSRALSRGDCEIDGKGRETREGWQTRPCGKHGEYPHRVLRDSVAGVQPIVAGVWYRIAHMIARDSSALTGSKGEICFPMPTAGARRPREKREREKRSKSV